MLVTTIDAQWEGMGDVGSARYEPALLSPMPDYTCVRHARSFQVFSSNTVSEGFSHQNTLQYYLFMGEDGRVENLLSSDD